jgi:hypothetical protein
MWSAWFCKSCIARTHLQTHESQVHTGFRGVHAVEKFAFGATSTAGNWVESWSRVVPHPHGRCTVHAFPWGTMVFHLVEELAPGSLAEVGLWRSETHRRELAWTPGVVDALVGVRTEAAYVLSAFWMDQPAWSGAQLDAAMRLLCTPSTLAPVNAETLDREIMVEQRFLQEGYDAEHLVNFGVPGTSVGWASWAGVSYFPIAADHALPAAALVEFEMVVQAVWCYCDHLREQVARGLEPIVPVEYGWRWLRTLRARLVGSRARETTQRAKMRSAIMQTSELTEHLDQTLVLLRDFEMEADRDV